MEEFNKKSGLERDIKAGEQTLRCNGLADNFMAPASLFQRGTDSHLLTEADVRDRERHVW